MIRPNVCDYSDAYINMQTNRSCKTIVVVMPMYDLIDYSDNYTKKSGSLWQYYRDE